jgi:glucose/arabinose dehydrogenase
MFESLNSHFWNALEGNQMHIVYSSFRQQRPCVLLKVGLWVLLSLLFVFQQVGILGAQEPARSFNVRDIKLEAGYRIEPLVANLSVLTTGIFDGPDLLLAESGWQNTAPPRILRVTPDMQVKQVASEGLEAPVTGLAVVDGTLYVSHKGRVSVVENGALRDVMTGLPSDGDHQNNNLALGPEGKLYLGQGTVTNSAVVGVDSYIFGWLKNNPNVREIPCQDVVLTGQNFMTENPLTPDAADTVTTGAYKPFGTASAAGEVIAGNIKCGGSILRFNPDGSEPELVAWGLRNPFGLEFDADGQLWATYHGADVRGSRNIYNDPDYLVRVEQGAWYGWPEYFDSAPVTEERFNAPGKPKPEFLWESHPPLTKPFTTFGTHEGVNGIAISSSPTFGFEGDAFVAMFGTFAPITTGVNMQPVGFRVVRVDTDTGEVSDFASNVIPGPGYISQHGGFDRPSDVVFAPDGSLYVMDWGAATVDPEGLKLVPFTGAVWRIYPETGTALRPNGPLFVPASTVIPPQDRTAEVQNVPELYKMLAPELLVIVGGLALIAVVVFVLVRRTVR